MTTYNVLRRDSHYFVIGLADDWGHADSMLLFRYPEGDCDSPHDAHKMHSCLYDLRQCSDLIKDGDEFVTPHGLFRVWRSQVEQVTEMPREAKARRARVRRLERALVATIAEAPEVGEGGYYVER